MASIRRKRYHLVLGLDFGTTFTGVAFALSKKEQIHSINRWPSSNPRSPEVEKQAPSILAYPAEPSSPIPWGYQVTPEMEKSCAYMKLHLDKDAPPAAYDNPDLKDAIQNGYFRLPDNTLATTATLDYLTEVFKYVKEFLTQAIGKYILDVTRIEFWITKPAASGDEAQHITKRLAEEAARNAGFAEHGVENFFGLVGESEVALMANLLETSIRSEDALMPGNNILVCDCGGGQVDIAVYKVVQVTTPLKLEQMTIVQGPKCGATQIDRNLHKLMENKFGARFTELGAKKDMGSLFMNDFEINKRIFGKERDGHPQKLIPMRLQINSPRSRFYRKSGDVVLTTEHMKRLFEPVVTKIKDLVSKQVTEAESLPGERVTDIALVGGFGDSPYLRSELQAWCDQRDHRIKLRILQDSWGAVARGAVAYGLEKAMVTKRLSQSHYGIPCDLPFRQGDDVEKRYFEDGIWWSSGCVDWIVQKGTQISSGLFESHEFTQELYQGNPQFSFDIISSRADIAPRQPVNGTQKVNRINITLTSKDLVGVEIDRRGMLKFRFVVEVVFGEREGTVIFRPKTGRRVLEMAEVEFLPNN